MLSDYTVRSEALPSAFVPPKPFTRSSASPRITVPRSPAIAPASSSTMWSAGTSGTRRRPGSPWMPTPHFHLGLAELESGATRRRHGAAHQCNAHRARSGIHSEDRVPEKQARTAIDRFNGRGHLVGIGRSKDLAGSRSVQHTVADKSRMQRLMAAAAD